MRELTSQEICVISGGKDLGDTILEAIRDGLRALTGVIGPATSSGTVTIATDANGIRG